MLVKSLSLWLGTPLILLANALGRTAQTNSTASPISILISTQQAVVPAGSPIKIKAEVNNGSDQPLGEIYPYSYDVSVRDSNGNPLDKKSDYEFRIRQEYAIVRHQIPAGEIVARSWVLNDIYNISRPGRYSIQVRGPRSVLSNVITVTVTDNTAEPSESEALKTSFSLEIEMLQDIIRVGSKAVLSVQAMSNTSQEASFNNGPGLFSLEVRDAQGRLAPLTEMGRNFTQHFSKSGASISLHPGMPTGTNDFVVTDLYDLSTPGEYTLQVSRFDGETRTVVKSNTTTLTVRPK